MEFTIEDFRFFHPIEVRWNDLDPLAHVNNVVYFDYFQNARGHYMVNASKSWDWDKDMFVIANISCNFMAEVKLNALNPRVGVRVVRLGSKSFVVEYVVISEGEGRSVILHAKGESTQVLIDMQHKRTKELPDWFLEELKEYEPAL